MGEVTDADTQSLSPSPFSATEQHAKVQSRRALRVSVEGPAHVPERAAPVFCQTSGNAILRDDQSIPAHRSIVGGRQDAAVGE
jgi:hypothetical protein